MFERTRRKLIVMYSSLIGLILTVLILLFYLILANSIWSNVDKQLDVTSRQVAKQVMNQLQRKIPAINDRAQLRKTPLPGERKFDNFDAVPLNQFVMVMTNDHSVEVHSLNDEQLQTYIKSAFEAGGFLGNNKKLLTYEGNRTFKFNSIALKNDDILFIGTEVTESVSLLRNMKWLLSLLAIGLLLFSAGVGYWLAGRAMVPIQHSYRRQQEFVADASHELRTPLSIFGASVEILEEEQEALPPFHQKVLSDMKEELARMNRLILGLLTLARWDSGREEIVRAPFNIGQTIGSVLEAFSLLLQKSQVHLAFTTSIPNGNVIFYGDEERIKQLLFIILDNALKYNKPGGEITLDLQQNQHDIILSVIDTGEGITSEQIPLIFERFYRADKGRSRTQGGVGLGLSIAAWIVEAHGGKIKAFSEPAQGTTIEITLKNSRSA